MYCLVGRSFHGCWERNGRAGIANTRECPVLSNPTWGGDGSITAAEIVWVLQRILHLQPNPGVAEITSVYSCGCCFSFVCCFFLYELITRLFSGSCVGSGQGSLCWSNNSYLDLSQSLEQSSSSILPVPSDIRPPGDGPWDSPPAEPKSCCCGYRSLSQEPFALRAIISWNSGLVWIEGTKKPTPSHPTAMGRDSFP